MLKELTGSGAERVLECRRDRTVVVAEFIGTANHQPADQQPPDQ
jgi:hypothetical protein